MIRWKTGEVNGGKEGIFSIENFDRGGMVLGELRLYEGSNC